MQHTLITPQSPGEQLAALAAGALDMAARQQTGAAGSATWHNEDGTRTVIGPDAGLSGIAPWVGDTTPPGMPTGIGVDSAAGMILVSWDGTLHGGIPADFDHIQILVDGGEAGQLRVRGTATLGPYEADSVHRVTARAWDDAHAEDGNPAPNGSDPTKPVSVTVKSVVDVDEIKAAQDKAQQAINEIAGVSKDVQAAHSAATTASGKADSALGKADTAASTADAASAAASDASNKAKDAVTKAATASTKADAASGKADAASNKADRALSNGAELVRNPGMDPMLGDLDGFGIGMDTGDAPSAPPQPYSHYAAIKQRDYFSTWRFPLSKDRIYRFGAWVIADKANRKDLRIGWRYTNPGTHWDECFTVHAKDALTWTWVDGYAKTPDTWDDKPNSMVMWLNVNAYGADAQGWWLTGLTVKDVTEAQGAQLTADGKNRTYTSQTEPAHAGLTPGDQWYRQDGTGNVVGVMIWDGTKFNRQVVMADQLLVPGSLGPISMADGSVTAVKIKADEAMLKKLLVRKLLADEIDVGSLAAAIIQSEKFVTKDGLNGVDETGFWTKDKSGTSIFRASGDGVQATGGFQTAAKGDRIQLSQILFKGSTIGGLQGIGDDPETPYWLIWGDHDEDGIASRLMMGTSTQQSEICVFRDDKGRNNVSLTADDIAITGFNSTEVEADDVHLTGHRSIRLDADAIWVRGVRLPVSGIATGGYTHHQGAWEISFKQAETRYGDLSFTTGGNPGSTYGVQGLRIPCTGYWLISGAVNVTGSGSSASLGLGIYHEASGKIDTFGDGFVLDFTLSPSKWVSQAVPSTVEFLEAGDVVMWRGGSILTAGAGPNYMIATLLPF